VDFSRQSWLHIKLVILFKSSPVFLSKVFTVEGYDIQGRIHITLNHEY